MSCPSIFVSVPSNGFVHGRFAVCLAEAVKAYPGKVRVASTEGSNVAQNRNEGVLEARRGSYDYILFLDSDLTFPAQLISTLVDSAKPDKLITGCNYARRGAPHVPLVVPLPGAAQVAGVCRVAALPAGALLIGLQVFDLLPFPWFNFSFTQDATSPTQVNILSEDYYFCQQARGAGIDVWLDTAASFDVVHWGMVGLRWQAQTGKVALVNSMGKDYDGVVT